MDQVKKDSEYFKKMFEDLDREGCFNDVLPNTWMEYNEEREFADLLRYRESLQCPNSLSFWGLKLA